MLCRLLCAVYIEYIAYFVCTCLLTVDVVACAIDTFAAPLCATAAVSRPSVEWKVVVSRTCVRLYINVVSAVWGMCILVA